MLSSALDQNEMIKFYNKIHLLDIKIKQNKEPKASCGTDDQACEDTVTQVCHGEGSFGT